MVSPSLTLQVFPRIAQLPPEGISYCMEGGDNLHAVRAPGGPATFGCVVTIAAASVSATTLDGQVIYRYMIFSDQKVKDCF